MGPDWDVKHQSNVAMDVLASQGNGSISRDPEDNHMQCTSNYKDKNFHVEPLHNDLARVPDEDEDVEINITECINSGVDMQLEAISEETYESMSSFGDTVSDTENAALVSDSEIESRLCVGDAPSSMLHGYDGTFQVRKKKLTDQWRRFIRPLMWRSKWIELQIKEFQSQAVKYEKGLAEHEQRKHFDFDSFMLEGFDARSLKFSSGMRRVKVVKRKKRKRLEETTNIASYMLHHNVFSYCENKKSFTSGAMDDCCGDIDKLANGNDEFGFQDGWLSLEPSDGDNILKHILRKIEAVQSQVSKLRARIDKVVSENPGKFASVNRLSLPVPCNAITGSDRNPALSPANKDRISVRSQYTLSQHMSECSIGDLMPESAVSSHGEVAFLTDMIDSPGQAWVEVSCENAGERVLILDQAGKEKMRNNNFGEQLAEKLQAPMEKQTGQASEVDLPMETFVARARYGGKSIPSSRLNVSNKKRKRGRRKSGAGGWSRRLLG